MDQTVLSYKNIAFGASLKSVQLTYHGAPRVDASDCQRQVDEAYARGREEATQSYNNQILQQRTEVQQLLGQTLEQMDLKVDQCLREVFEEIPGLVTHIARRVLAEVEIDGEMVQRIVQEIISDLPGNRGEIEVFLCEKDLELLQSYLEDAEHRFPHCVFRADPQLDAADCRVVSRFGAIDGRVATKLKHIEDQLRS